MRLHAIAFALLASLAAACTTATPAPATFSAGYQTMRITDANNRPIALDIWFPAQGIEAEHNYGISQGHTVDAASVSGEHLPLILLSHGAMGAAVNYSWIAETLARHGYVVLGVSHFGESPTFGQANINPANVAHFGDRTRDFRAALDWILAEPAYVPHIEATRVGLIGHSSGGATVIMLAGGQFSQSGIVDYCRTPEAKGDKSCAYPVSATPDPKQAPEALGRNIGAVVALDPALGTGFSTASLAAMTEPVLVIGSEQNDFLHFDAHAGRFMSLLPKAERTTLNAGEGHFVYVDGCDVPIMALGVPLCKDRAGVDRTAVHDKLGIEIVAFFDKTLRAK